MSCQFDCSDSDKLFDIKNELEAIKELLILLINSKGLTLECKNGGYSVVINGLKDDACGKGGEK